MTPIGNMVDSRAETWFTTDMTTIRHQAHAEFTDDGILVLFANGEVRHATTPEKALAMVRRRDNEWMKGRVQPTVLITDLTWHNCPEGFVPPGESSHRKSGVEPCATA